VVKILDRCERSKMSLLKFVGDTVLVAIGRKVPQSTIYKLESSGKWEISYRNGTLETFGNGFLLRRPETNSHPCFDGRGYYTGQVNNFL